MRDKGLCFKCGGKFYLTIHKCPDNIGKSLFCGQHRQMQIWLSTSRLFGHLISREGVAVETEKIRCIMEWPKPRNVKGVRRFLGLMGYYWKFVKNYGKIAKPLTELTKKDNFSWGQSASDAFNQLKQIMTTSPVLALPNFSLAFEVECDAGRGIGFVLDSFL